MGEAMQFTGRRAELKAAFIEARGYWADFWDKLLALDPDFFETYLGYSAIPWKHGVLDPKLKEFIYITIDISTTHLYELGTRIHYQNAIRHGATPEEIMEVIKVVSGLGVHTLTLGVGELVAALGRAGRQDEVPDALTPEQAALKEAFIAQRGFWDESYARILKLDPRIFEAALALTGNPHRTGVLGEKVIALIHIAANASVTHLHQPTLAIQMDRALAAGASVPEILEVLQLASVLGLHSCTFGVPILADELAALGRPIAPNG
jgi:alkylhydroperoxidase/carboxymuconolactone decarboxylase family protein YurZ